MPRSRPASNPVSFHKHTGQYYVTRLGKRVYLGSDRDQALRRYHEIGLGVEAGAQDGPARLYLSSTDGTLCACQAAVGPFLNG